MCYKGKSTSFTVLALPLIAGQPWASDIASLSLTFLFGKALRATTYFTGSLKRLPEMMYEE